MFVEFINEDGDSTFVSLVNCIEVRITNWSDNLNITFFYEKEKGEYFENERNYEIPHKSLKGFLENMRLVSTVALKQNEQEIVTTKNICWKCGKVFEGDFDPFSGKL